MRQAHLWAEPGAPLLLFAPGSDYKRHSKPPGQ
jgi:hypothetical protein